MEYSFKNLVRLVKSKKKLKNDIVIKCEKLEEAKELFKWLSFYHLTWFSGEEYNPDETYWEDYEENTCYDISRGGFCREGYFKPTGKIINFKDIIFEEKSLTEEETLVLLKDLVNNFGADETVGMSTYESLAKAVAAYEYLVNLKNMKKEYSDKLGMKLL